MLVVFVFQAEDGIRDAQESRGLGDVYKRQVQPLSSETVTVYVPAGRFKLFVPLTPFDQDDK